MDEAILELAYRLHKEGRSFVLATVVRAERPTSAKPGARGLVTEEGRLVGWVGGSCAEPTVLREARRALADGRPRLLRLLPPESWSQAAEDGVENVPLTCVSGGTLEIYLEPHRPRPRLVVVGHQAVAEALVVLGKDLGYEVVVMAPGAAPDRFARADAVESALDFSRLRPVPETYVVVASHGNYDEEALEAALAAGLDDVSLVASPKRAAAVVQELRAAGVAEDAIGRIRAPAGLDIGAVGPEEIALSILAGIVERRRRRPAAVVVETAEAAEARDPVCGMTVALATARERLEHGGRAVYFCSSHCRRAFEREPDAYPVG